MPTFLGVWSLELFSSTFFSTSSKKRGRCGPHPLQVISWRVRPPLVKGAGCIGPLFPDFRGWQLWFMASIALRGLHKTLHWRLFLVPYCTLRLSHLSVGENTRRLEMIRPTRHVGVRLWGLLGPTAHELLGRRHLSPCLSHMVG